MSKENGLRIQKPNIWSNKSLRVCAILQESQAEHIHSETWDMGI